jgi:hypothetical protein
MNNFYGTTPWQRKLFDAHTSIISFLRDTLKGVGGEFEEGLTGMHAEEIMKEEIDKLELPEGSLVIVGVSRSICPSCLRMGEELGNGALKVTSNGVTIIMSGPR